MGNKVNNFKRKIKTKFKRMSLSIKSFNFSFLKKLKYLILMHWTFPKKIFLGILIIWILGAILLYTPWAINYESYTYVNNEYVFVINQAENIDFFINQPSTEFHYNFLDAIFTSASAFTNTGLTIVSSIGTELSIFGQFVVFVLIEVGGFGYASLFYLLGKMIQKISKKSLFSTSLLNIERGGTKVSNSSKMIVRIFFIMIVFQLIFTFVLSGFFYSTPLYEQQTWENLITTLSDKNIDGTFDIGNIKNISLSKIHEIGNYNLFSLTFDNVEKKLIPTHGDYGKSFWYALFISCSSVNNAGFDLFGSTSLQLFRNDNGIAIQFIILILVFIGGIGFPVLYDISIQLEWFWKYKILFKIFKKKEYSRIIKPKISNFAKLCLLSALVISVISILILFLTEYIGSNNHLEIELSQNGNHIINSNVSLMNYPNLLVFKDDESSVLINIKFWGENAYFNKNFSIVFNALCCRSAGFSTINFQSLSEASIIVFSILMFIGTSPSSTGGGIRTTTLFIIFKSLFSWFRGVERTSVFKRKVPIKTINNSYLVFLSALVLVSFFTIIMYVTSNHTILNNNLVKDYYANKGKILDFSSFFFEVCSAFGTSGNSFGITGSSQIQSWNLVILMILMFVGQMGVSSSLLLFARKIPKKRETFYLEEDVRIG